MNTNQDWKLVPVEPTSEMWAAVNKLDDQMAAGGYDGKGASIEQVWNCLVETAPEAPPLAVTVDPDARGVSVGVYQGSRCVYSGAHPIPASTQADERDWELTCEGCDGDGFVYVERRVGMCATDVQEFKEECECCEGRGFTFAFGDIPGIAEYVKSCRPASTVATEGEQLATFEANFPNAPLSASKFHELWSLAGAGCTPRHALLDNLRWQVGVFAGLVAREAIACAPAAGDALDDSSLLNIRFTPVSEGMPELVEYSSSYGGQWSSDWCAVITTRGHIEHTRLVVPGSQKDAPGKGQFYGTWRAGMESTRVVAWAYLSKIRSAADAAIAQQSQRKEA